MFLESLATRIAEMDDDLLQRVLEFVLSPPVEEIRTYNYAVRGWGQGLPPQPSLELIPREVLERRLGEEGVESFLAVDAAVSILPMGSLSSLREDAEEALEVLRDMAERLRESARFLEKVKAGDLISEDALKERVLLMLPSERQLAWVRGRWRELAWKRTTLRGGEAPTGDGWLRDVEGLAEALRSEGVETIVAADRESAHRLPGHVGRIISLNIPQNLPKIGYPRDPSVTWAGRPILGNMALWFRRGEEEVASEVFWRLGLIPLARPRWAQIREGLARVRMEGGNFFLIKADETVALITGIGVRGSDPPLFQLLNQLLPHDVRIFGVPLAGYLREWEVGAVHLDVAFNYLGDLPEGRIALVDPARLGFYSVLEYVRESNCFKPLEMAELARQLGILLDEPPREGASPITMTNALNLGKGRLVVDSWNRETNRYLEKVLGAELIEVEIPEIEAGGGGPRCATRELLKI